MASSLPQKIEISHRTIIFTLLVLVGGWVFIQISDIILRLFIAFILMSALRPIVERIARLGVPRALAIFIIYISLWLIVGGLIASMIPSLIKQTQRMIEVLPTAIGQLDFFSNHQQEISNQVLTYVGTLPENILRLTISIFSNVIDILTTFVVSFYLLLYRPRLNQHLAAWFGNGNEEKIADTLAQIEKRLGDWVRGELVLMFAVGSLTYVGLIILGVDSALPLAILAGLLEIVPNIGPLLSCIPSVLIALTIHPVIAVATACLYFVVQFLENHLLVPNIMRKAVGVNPLVSIVGLMVGFKLLGPIGAILAIPTVIVVQILSHKYFSLSRFTNNAPGD